MPPAPLFRIILPNCIIRHKWPGINRAICMCVCNENNDRADAQWHHRSRMRHGTHHTVRHANVSGQIKCGVRLMYP